MRVTVAIPSWNAADRLKLLLLTIGHTVLDPADSIEVVVADDGSTDGTEEMIAAGQFPFDLTYLYLPRTGRSSRAAARNAAIAKATGELVVFVDADQVIGPRFIAEHVRYHRLRDDLVVVGPRPDLGDGLFDEDRLAREFTFDALPALAWGDPRERLLTELSGNLNGLATCWHHMFTCNVSVRARHLQAVGGFDESFLGWGLEDCELGYRLRQGGLTFAFNAAAVAYHQRSRRVDARMYAEFSRNLAYMVAKHDAPEVAIQSLIGSALNPAERRLPWVEAARRFELAARALSGRIPGPVSYELMTVDESTVAEAADQLAARSATGGLLVIDDTPNAELAGPAQCVDTSHELLYFHRPSAADRSAILERFPVVRGNR